MDKKHHLSKDGKDLFKGKTIKEVKSSAINHWQFIFTDGTIANVWGETYGQYRIPGMYAE